MNFTILGQPQGKERSRVSKKLCAYRFYTPKKTVTYQELIYTVVIPKLRYPNEYYDKALKMRIAAFYKIPGTFNQTKQKQATAGELRPVVKPDLDNIAKVVCDALNKCLYNDDKQIVSLTVEKYYSDQPRVEVEVEIVE